MSENNYCVYMHTNKINGKKYVGITCRKPEVRWNGGNGYYRNKHFYSAIKKYGWDNFEHEIIADCLTSEIACKMEKDLIAKYKSNQSEFGYNICDGGQTNILPKESLEKISKANKGRKISEEAKNKRALNPPKARRIVCDGVQYLSCEECALHYGLKGKQIVSWLNGHDYIPENFVEMGLNDIENPIEYVEVFAKRKWVYCDGLEFSSIPKCAEFYNIPFDRMKHWLYGIYQMPKEFQEKNLHQFNKIRFKAKIKKS